MELLLPLVLGFLACLFGGLYLLGVFRQRRPGEPPLDKGWIPWLGHALEFRRDPHKLLQKMREKHGDIFTIQVGGLYFTILLDPLSLEAFVKQGRDTFNARMVAKYLAKIVFGYVPVDDEISFFNQKLLQGDALQDLTESMTSNLQNIMLNNLSSAQEQRKWTKDGLFKFCFNILFRTVFLTLFGNTPSQTKGDKDKAKAQDRAETEGLFNEFYKYDQLFPSLVYGVLSSNFQREAQRLNRFFTDALSLDKMRNKDNISGWILDIQQTLRNHGTSELMIDRFMLSLLWASQGNMTAPAFWLLYYLMKEPEAMEALKREVDDVLRDSEQEVRPGGPLVHLTHDMLMKTPVLDSAIEETLRLITAPLLTRLVCQDTTLKMANGQKFLLRKGDRIGTFPYMMVQTDPEIHPDPHTFKYDRFRSPDGTKKRDFYKGGQRVKYYSLPFGSGLSMCPGRFFATNQLKQFVFHMLVYFDFELVNPDENIPQFKIQRFGLGTLPPEREIHFQYRLRFLDNNKKVIE